MHAFINMSLYLKNYPKEYRGLVHNHYGFNKKTAPASFSMQLIRVIQAISDYYLQTGLLTKDGLLDQLNELSEMVTEIKVVDKSE